MLVFLFCLVLWLITCKPLSSNIDPPCRLEEVLFQRTHSFQVQGKEQWGLQVVSHSQALDDDDDDASEYSVDRHQLPFAVIIIINVEG